MPFLIGELSFPAESSYIGSVRSYNKLQAFNTDVLMSPYFTMSDWLYRNRRHYRVIIALLTPASLRVLTLVGFFHVSFCILIENAYGRVLAIKVYGLLICLY